MRSSPTALLSVAEAYFDRYAYPAWLRTHSRLAGRVAAAFTGQAQRHGVTLDAESVVLGALLHDLGRSPLLAGLPGEHHVGSAAVLAAEGRAQLVELVRRHSVYAPLQPSLTPRTLEEQLVYLADRRAGLRLMTVRERVLDLGARHPEYAHETARALDAALAIEAEVAAALGLTHAALEALPA